MLKGEFLELLEDEAEISSESEFWCRNRFVRVLGAGGRGGGGGGGGGRVPPLVVR